ncbi:MAG: hypothetical protein JO277_11715, partial [Candidatus Eremiobacteraeota bacterium]|nr:hypothetical protein [Candidatus Eremiobacteraeota bacterium]
MEIPFTQADWNAVIPVAIVAVTALVVLLADLLALESVERYVSIGVGLAGCAAAAVFAAAQFGHDYNAFFGSFMTGGFTTVFEEIVLVAAAGSLILYGS